MKKTGFLLLIRRSTGFVRSDLSNLSDQSDQSNLSDQSDLSNRSDWSDWSEKRGPAARPPFLPFPFAMCRNLYYISPMDSIVKGDA